MSETDTMERPETRSFTAEVSKVLQLMIHSLYANRDIFLRELISNASDACDKLRYDAQQNDALLKEDSELRIRLEIDPEARTLTVVDNGIGMNRDELVDNLGTIARSGSQEFLASLTGDKKQDVELIGQFGVGFYSAFIVADKVTVTSRRAGADEAWQWESNGEGEFTIAAVEGKNAPRGTAICLHLREGSDYDVYLDKFRLKHIVETYSNHISIPIEATDEEGNVERINAGSALWTRSKNEVTEDEYKAFYKSVSHAPDHPWMTLHVKAEGTIEYTALLFIPVRRPFDLFHPDRRRRVKLYIKRVFITDENVELIPHWLRFLRGVIDSEDLPLNVSRETLQHNHVLDRIRSSIEKRILKDLKQRAKEDPEGFAEFWTNFGPVMKEGLCESMTVNEPLLEICRFYSSKSPDTLISFDEYIERMHNNQQAIYYLTGEDVETMLRSPQLEGFKKRNIEVLLLCDHVDDFWVNVVHEYKDKPLASVTSAVLGEAEGVVSEDDAKDDASDASADDKKPEGEALNHLLAKLKEIYGEEVKDVRTTYKLTDSPVCLAVGEGDMGIRMERFLVENKQLPGRSARILELNPAHAVVRRLVSLAEGEEVTDEFRDAAFLLLDQARIQEGETIRDPSGFARRMTALMTKGLAA